MPEEPAKGAELPIGDPIADAPPVDYSALLDLENEAVSGEEAGEEPPEEPPKKEPPKEEPPKEEPLKEEPPEEPKAPKPLTAEELKAKRDEALKMIEGRFVFSDEDKQTLVDDPSKILARMGAQVQLETYEMILGAMQGVLPGLIAAHLHAQVQGQEGDNKFFTRWPGLKEPKHRKVLAKISSGYRKMFPDASVEDAIEDIGVMASRRLGLPPTPALEEKPTSPSPRKPFVPAGRGAASPSPKSASAKSDEAKMWAELVEE